MAEGSRLVDTAAVPQLKSYHVSESVGFLLEFPLVGRTDCVCVSVSIYTYIYIYKSTGTEKTYKF